MHSNSDIDLLSGNRLMAENVLAIMIKQQVRSLEINGEKWFAHRDIGKVILRKWNYVNRGMYDIFYIFTDK